MEADPTTPLGHVGIPERTFEHDLAVQERYQAFSAELLRLDLLGISAVGLVVINLMFPQGDASVKNLPLLSDIGLIIGLLCFGISAGAALTHRYCSADSLSWHLSSLRRGIRRSEEDATAEDVERHKRYRQFKASRTALLVSAIALGIAAAALVFAVIGAVFVGV